MSLFEGGNRLGLGDLISKAALGSTSVWDFAHTGSTHSRRTDT
jgi:hypothetical protein